MFVIGGSVVGAVGAITTVVVKDVTVVVVVDEMPVVVVGAVVVVVAEVSWSTSMATLLAGVGSAPSEPGH